jgi:hypothetical protein
MRLAHENPPALAVFAACGAHAQSAVSKLGTPGWYRMQFGKGTTIAVWLPINYSDAEDAVPGDPVAAAGAVALAPAH